MLKKNILKKRIEWKCRRGMLEIDVMLHRFFHNHFDELNTDEQISFEGLLDQADPDLYNWLIGYSTPESKSFMQIIQKIQSLTAKRF